MPKMFHLWSEQYDENQDDIFAVQDSVAKLVASKLINRSAHFPEKKYSAIDFEAYDYFLKGTTFHRKFGELLLLNDFEMAKEMLLKALEINPNYAEAHTELADLYNTFTNIYAHTDHYLPDQERYKELQKREIEIAYSLDPNSDHVHRIKGYVLEIYGEIDSAYHSYRKALELAPNNPENLVSLAGFMHSSGGLYDEAIILTNRAIEMSPLETYYLNERAGFLFWRGRFDDAEKECREILKIKPYDPAALFRLCNIYLLNNKLKKAEELYEQIKPYYLQDSTYSYLKVLEAWIYAAKGDKKRALKEHENILIYLLLGEKEESIKKMIERQVVYNGHFTLENFEIHDLVRDDPRFQELVARKKKEYQIAKEKYGDLSFLKELP